MNLIRTMLLIMLVISTMLPIAAPIKAAEELKGNEIQIKKWAEECRDEITEQMNLLLTSGRLTMGQLFDTFYVPIPNTYPQKYTTQYDKLLDETIQKILDKYLSKDPKIVFVVAVDTNGYLPTHNTKYSQPLTGNKDTDALNNRAKRIFNDRTGLAAARNTEPYLLQKYARDTGEQMGDLSVPITIRKQHWGAVRFGFRRD